MAATETGVWSLQDVRDKQLASEWSYTGAPDKLYVVGKGEYGDLGQNNTTYNYSSPTQVPGEGWNIADTSWYNGSGVYVSKSDGTLWVWGYNSSGILGLNDEVWRSSPTQLGTDTTWTAKMGSTGSMSLAVKTDGTAWVWGNAHDGVLGLNESPNADKSSPTQIGTGTDWETCSVGGEVFGLIKTNNLYVWGPGNTGGCLGQNQSGSVGLSSPMQVGTDSTWSHSARHLSFGKDNCGAIKTDGTLWGWGSNTYGILGQNNTTQFSSPKQVGTDTTWRSVSFAYKPQAMATKTDGTLWTWGKNYRGSLGHNEGNYSGPTYSSPKQVGTDTTWSEVICAANMFAGALKTDGTAWAWGGNTSGQLGQNDRTSYSSPVQIPGTAWTDMNDTVQEGFQLTSS